MKQQYPFSELQNDKTITRLIKIVPKTTQPSLCLSLAMIAILTKTKAAFGYQSRTESLLTAIVEQGKL